MSDSNISPNDIKILIALTIAVVGISLVFPMMGLGSTSADDPRDIPTMELDTDRYDFAGEFPSRPDSEGSGELRSGTGYAQSESQRAMYLSDPSGEIENVGEITNPAEVDSLIMFIAPNQESITEQDGDFAVYLYATNDQIPTTEQGTIDFTQINANNPEWVNAVVFDADDQPGSFDMTVETGDGTPEMSMTVRVNPTRTTLDMDEETVDYRVTYDVVSIDSPSDGGGLLSGLPIIGTLFSGGADILGGIILFVQQVIWFVGTVISIIVNGVSLVAQAITFLGETLAFVIGGYADVLASAPGGVASVVLAFPGLLLGIQVIRVSLVAVNTIWVG